LTQLVIRTLFAALIACKLSLSSAVMTVPFEKLFEFVVTGMLCSRWELALVNREPELLSDEVQTRQE
jgi:hypothetical protein